MDLTYGNTGGSVPQQTGAIPLLAVADHRQLGNLAKLPSGRARTVAVVAVIAVGVDVHGGRRGKCGQMPVRNAALDKRLLLQATPLLSQIRQDATCTRTTK